MLRWRPQSRTLQSLPFLSLSPSFSVLRKNTTLTTTATATSTTGRRNSLISYFSSSTFSLSAVSSSSLLLPSSTTAALRFYSSTTSSVTSKTSNINNNNNNKQSTMATVASGNNSNNTTTSSEIKNGSSIRVPQTCTVKHTQHLFANGVRAIIVEDPSTKMCACSGSMYVGSHYDFPGIANEKKGIQTEGLAHFCEHMLFLGTENYPQEGALDKFLSENSGHSNAWTTDSNTVYYATCSAKVTEEAIDRFMHMFVCPTLTQSATDREVKQIESEDAKNHPVDYWCVQEIIKLHLVDKEHPHSRYGNGNKKTLVEDTKEAGTDLYAQLLEFYKQHYSAENLVAVVYSPIPTEKVLEQLTQILSKVKNGTRNEHRVATVPRLIAPQHLGTSNNGAATWINFKANTETQRLTLMFPTRSCKEDYLRFNPSHYVSWILGHECKGTLVDVLKEEDYCVALSTGGSRVDDENSLFAVDVSLTSTGLANIHKVIDLVFDGIDFMKNKVKADKELFEDMTAGGKLEFGLAELRAPANHASSLASSANTYGLEKAWCGNMLNDEMHEEKIMNHMSYLRADNCFFILHLPDPDKVIRNSSSSSASASVPAETEEDKEEKKKKEAKTQSEEEEEEEDEEEEGTTDLRLPLEELKACGVLASQESIHHKAKFGISKVDQSLLQHWGRTSERKDKWHPSFKKPVVNPFISTDFTVHTAEGESGETWGTRTTPKLIYENEIGRVHWRPDADMYKSPKSCVTLLVETPFSYSNPEHRFFCRVLIGLVEYSLSELMYFAELGAYRCDINAMVRGWQLTLFGPSQKIQVLAKAVLEAALDEMLSGKITANETKYKAVADKVLRDIRSIKVNAPYQQCQESIMQHAYEHRIHFTEILDAIEDTIPPFDKFLDFARKIFLSRVRYDLLVVGNSTEKEAEELGKVAVEQTLKTKIQPSLQVATPQEFEKFSNVLALPPRPQGKFAHCISQKSTNPKDNNCSAIVTFHLGASTPETNVLVLVVTNLLKAHYFECLRTKETLGYIVSCGSQNNDSNRFINFIAQSAERTAWYCFSRTFAFLQAAEEQIFNQENDAKLQEQVRKAAAALVAQNRDKPKSVTALSSRIWNLRHFKFGYEILEDEAKLLEDENIVNSNTVREFFMKQIASSSSQAAAVLALAHGTEESLKQFESVPACTLSHSQQQKQQEKSSASTSAATAASTSGSTTATMSLTKDFSDTMPARAVEIPSGGDALTLDDFKNPADLKNVSVSCILNRDGWRESLLKK